MRSEQAFHIAQIGVALTRAGITTLDAQAAALGLTRSTAWTILNASHKASGLSARTVSQMLASEKLPPAVRDVIVSYVEAKIAGRFGHLRKVRERFALRVNIYKQVLQ